jgi:hypothetical protein
LGDFNDDLQGSGIKNALKLLNFSDDSNETIPDNNNQTDNNKNNDTNNDTNNNTNNNTNDKNNSVTPSTGYKLPYPIYFAYVNGVSTWWGDDFLAGMGVPGYAP